MPSDTTFLYFQRGRDYISTDPFYSCTRWTSNHGARASSVPRTSLTRHRASSVPRTGLTVHRAQSLPPLEFSHAASAINGRATVERRSSTYGSYGPSVYSYRKGGHSYIPSLTYATSPKGSVIPVYSYTGVPLIPIHSYSQAKGGIIITAPQRYSPSTTSRSQSASRPTAFYRAPTSSRGGAERDRDWSVKRNTSTNRERVHNGYGKIKVVQGQGTVDNGPAKISYEIKENPFLPNQKATLSELKSRAQVARTQLGKHRVLLDRYLPVSLEKPTDVDDVIANKYGELLIRMPQLEYRHRPKSSIDEAPLPLIITPYTPVYTKHQKIDKQEALSLPPLKNSFTQKISDPRKHARRVLCKIHGDPKYFDFS